MKRYSYAGYGAVGHGGRTALQCGLGASAAILKVQLRRTRGWLTCGMAAVDMELFECNVQYDVFYC